MQADPNQKLTIIGLIVAIIIGSGYYFYNHFLVPKPPEITSQNSINNNSQTPVIPAKAVVHVCGAVRSEGVYSVNFNNRIYDVIKLAGGGMPNADFSSINLAERVKDGQKIEIPFKKLEQIVEDSTEQAVKNSKKLDKNSSNKKININTASAEELDSLPGVGLSTAKKIIAARPFGKVEDLLKVPRFGKSKLDKIKERIVI